MEPHWLNSEEAAAYLKCCTKTVNRLALIGRVRSYKIGHRSLRFDKADLDDYIRSCEVVHTRRRGRPRKQAAGA
jgi:excisionase family DNA binding protein